MNLTRSQGSAGVLGGSLGTFITIPGSENVQSHEHHVTSTLHHMIGTLVPHVKHSIPRQPIKVSSQLLASQLRESSAADLDSYVNRIMVDKGSQWQIRVRAEDLRAAQCTQIYTPMHISHKNIAEC